MTTIRKCYASRGVLNHGDGQYETAKEDFVRQCDESDRVDFVLVSGPPQFNPIAKQSSTDDQGQKDGCEHHRIFSRSGTIVRRHESFNGGKVSHRI